MKKFFLFAILCGFTMTVFAQRIPDKDVSTKPASADIAAIQTANSLAKYGYSMESASALIGAAEIFAQVQTQLLGTDPEQGSSGNKPLFTPASLIADAKKFAAGDPVMLAWASEVEASLGVRTRGAVGGPKEGYSSVAPNNGYISYKLAFRAGELAEILVVGDGVADIDLYIYDQNGNLIGSDDDYSDECYVSFVPRWTGSFTIEVVNRGRRSSNFSIVTN
jgi:hypothetical protein